MPDLPRLKPNPIPRVQPAEALAFRFPAFCEVENFEGQIVPGGGIGVEYGAIPGFEIGVFGTFWIGHCGHEHLVA